jgi:hypothetical protein
VRKKNTKLWSWLRLENKPAPTKEERDAFLRGLLKAIVVFPKKAFLKSQNALVDGAISKKRYLRRYPRRYQEEEVKPRKLGDYEISV